MTKLDDGGRGKVDQELRKYGFEFSEIDRRDVIDFVLADRLRIVEPLTKYKNEPLKNTVHLDIIKTLELSGALNDKS